MPVYDISIELRGKVNAAEEYRRLRNAMNNNGFRHSISNGSQQSYWLPRDLFTYEGDISKQELMDRVYNLLTEFVPAPGVMVTESVGRCWRGLREIEGF
ncbi:hypothetical protein PANPA_00115 (plasmid) [Pantoea sp. Nvir]|uniref:hypothetical protein n=1 Tax=Pantoea TaxID=53335 RepID=UPI000CDE03C0|nr:MULTISPECIES: hypothetical protein [Pantoea]MCG7367496.1 hypothetical protein [Pantoea sp. ACRSH]MCG7398006.1 hypothetical protein [Pantoea sp. ACRSC]POW55694.1 hypothetical protein C3408_17475 [Pantoea alvi]UBN52328.1 hypothetical protein LB453_01830 [Pantoea agglomerans]